MRGLQRPRATTRTLHALPGGELNLHASSGFDAEVKRIGIAYVRIPEKKPALRSTDGINTRRHFYLEFPFAFVVAL